MEIKGEVADIIYQNEINSYTISTFETEDELVTIVGYLPFITSGDTLKLFGKFVEHKDYGRQFKVDTFEKIMPETLSALEKYLGNGNVKGIGEVTARKIIRKFGDDTINIFKFEPERLAEIKGITKAKALEMSQSFLENWEVWQIVGFLERFKIGAEHAKKVYNLLGVNAIEQIEGNPYILIDIARGVDFKQIDAMALDLGISYDNQKRVESGIKYALIKATYNGHSCVVKENLIEFVITLLDVTTECIEDNLIGLKAKDEIVIEKRDGIEWIYLYNFYKVEEEIATRIIRLDNSKNMKKIEHIDKALKKVEEKSKIELSEKQKEAIKAINEKNVTIITGGPGTGKTTIIKTIIDKRDAIGDQDILQEYDHEWKNKPELHLKNKYNIFFPYLEYYVNFQEYSMDDLAVIHFIYPWKPWMLDKENRVNEYVEYIDGFTKECYEEEKAPEYIDCLYGDRRHAKKIVEEYCKLIEE